MLLCSCSKNEPVLVGTKKVITVDNLPGNPSGADYADINTAVLSATENTHIYVSEGIYNVNNPVILKQKGVRIIGKGHNKTLIYPKNAGKAIFKFKSDDLGIEGVGINAIIKDGFGRATFAVHFKKGISNCEVSKTKILNTGVSSIIGNLVNKCLVDGNIIVNAGDDAIRIKGDRLTISNNKLIRYYDEGIDVASGENIIVCNNYLYSGRIGIVVDDADNAIIYGNTVEDHRQQGIAHGSKSGGIVSHNTVRNGGEEAFQLYGPLFVNSNKVEGKNRLGFDVFDMKNGIIQHNIVWNAELGFKITNSNQNLINFNKYFGNEKQIIILEEDINNNLLYGNSSISSLTDKNSLRNETYNGIKTSEGLNIEQNVVKREKMLTTLLGGDFDINKLDNYLGEIDVKGETKQDREIAEKVAGFLKENNPGFLTVQVQGGNSMESEITNELYIILKGSGQLGIGVVRWPYMLFRWSSGSYFPLWHLLVEGREVAVVSRKQTGAKVRIYFKEEGKLSAKSTLSLLIGRFIAGLDSIYRKIRF